MRDRCEGTDGRISLFKGLCPMFDRVLLFDVWWVRTGGQCWKRPLTMGLMKASVKARPSPSREGHTKLSIVWYSSSEFWIGWPGAQRGHRRKQTTGRASGTRRLDAYTHGVIALPLFRSPLSSVPASVVLREQCSLPQKAVCTCL